MSRIRILSRTLLAWRLSFSLWAFVAGSSLSSSALEQLLDLLDPALLLEVELTRLPRRSLLLGLVSVLSGGSFLFLPLSNLTGASSGVDDNPGYDP